MGEKMSYTLEIQLAQFTPLIHFQHDRQNATLRATEFKPKFDRHLIERGVKSVKAANGNASVAYKLSVSPIGEVSKGEPNRFLYFANNPIKNENEKRKTVKHGKVRLIFFSFDQTILEAIDKHICGFLAVNNFGTRQSKGYGGFYPEKPTIAFEAALKDSGLIVYWINADPSNWQDKVDNAHKRLKAGINFPQRNIYNKSLLFEYMKTKNITWEKRAIKERWKRLAEGKAPTESVDPKTFRYVRALLGLAEHNEYRGKQVVKIDHKGGSIDRFKSPITYKFYAGKIYLVCNESYAALCGKEFIFNYNGEDLPLKVPDAFDIADFMNYAAPKLSLQRLIK
jgi:hypothetical protein